MSTRTLFHRLINVLLVLGLLQGSLIPIAKGQETSIPQANSQPRETNNSVNFGINLGQCTDSAIDSRLTVDNRNGNNAARGCIADASGYPEKVTVRIFNENPLWTKIIEFGKADVSVKPVNLWAEYGYIPPDSFAEYELHFAQSGYDYVQFWTNIGRSTEHTSDGKPDAALFNSFSFILELLDVYLETDLVEADDVELAIRAVEEVGQASDCVLLADSLWSFDLLSFLDGFRHCFSNENVADAIVGVVYRFNKNVSAQTAKKILRGLTALDAIRNIYDRMRIIVLRSEAGAVMFVNTSPNNTPAPPSIPKYDHSYFVENVTIPDGEKLTSGQAFSKVWRVYNGGTSTWSSSYKLTFRFGDQMLAPKSVNLPHSVAPDSSVLIRVNMVAPRESGIYQGNWQLNNAEGEFFGVPIRVNISVNTQSIPVNCSSDSQNPGIFLYEHKNYNRDEPGNCTHLLESVSDLSNTAVGDNAVSSIRINGDYTVRFYKDPDYKNLDGSTPEEVNDDDPDLDKRSMGGQYSSVRIESPVRCENRNLSGVYLYSERDYKGNCAHITADVANLENTPLGDDGLRSIRINGPYYVRLYPETGFKGTSEEVGSDDDDLTVRSLGDQISSVRFLEKNKPPHVFLNAANTFEITTNQQTIWSNVSDWSFSGTSSDEDGSVSRIEFNCDGDSCQERSIPVSGTSTWSYSRPNLTGYNRIYFFAYDDDGARSREQERHSVNLYVDQAPPQTTISLNGEANQERWSDWFTTSVQVQLDAQDGATGRARRGVTEIRYRLDGGEWQTVKGTTATFTVSTDGMHQVEFYAIDGVGNQEAPRSIPFSIDQTPPSPPTGVVETNGVQTDSWQRDIDTPTFTWAASDDATSGVWGYQFYFDADLNGIGYQTILADDQRVWTPKPNGVRTGTYYLRGRTRDVAGNWSSNGEWTNLFTFRYDGTPPENPDRAIHAAGIENDTWQRSTNLANFSWDEPHDEGSGISGYQVYWGMTVDGTADAIQSATSFQSTTPLCAVDSACTGYLRVRSIDNVQNQAEEWATVFTLRYDNAPPIVDFTFNGGVTETAQVQITLDIDASDLGSGVKEMRFSNDGQSWSNWEDYRTSRIITIPGISRKSWPVYMQVRDGVGLESPVVTHQIYFDVNSERPRSDRFQLYANHAGAGAGSRISEPSNLQLYSTVGQATDTRRTGSANFVLLPGYQAGSLAIPLIEPGYEEFTFINGLFGTGVVSATLHSSRFQMVGALGEVALPNNLTTLTSSNFQHQPGFLAAEPLVEIISRPPPESGPLSVPAPKPTCDFPQVSIEGGARFTNSPDVLLSLCAPRAVEMMIANENDFAGATWQPYTSIITWTLPVSGKTVVPRFVYALFKDDDGTVHRTYVDDIVYDPNPPQSALATSDGISASTLSRVLHGRSVEITQQPFFQIGSTVYLQQVRGRSLDQPIALLRTGVDGSVSISVDAQDDNSGLVEMQFSIDPTELDELGWEPYSAVKTWTPTGGDGVKTVYGRVRDVAGNQSDVSQTSFVVDSQAPMGGIALAQRVIGTNDSNLMVYLGANDNLTGVTEMRLSSSPNFDGAIWVPYSTSWVWPLDDSNTVGGTIYVQYRDLANNVSPTYSDSFVVDTVAPMVYAEVEAGESLTRTVQIYAYDELAGLNTLRVSNDPLMLTGTVKLAYTDILTWTFNDNRIAWVQVEDLVGNLTSPYPIYANMPYDRQSIRLNSGWNLNSFFIEPRDPSRGEVLQSIGGSYDWILGDGVLYGPSLEPPHNTLNELYPGRGYYINTTAADELIIVGERVPVTTPIPLEAGWNWIGYLPDSPLPLHQALESIADQYQRILSITDTYEAALPDNSYLTTLLPGQGYLIYINEPTTLVYPSTTGTSASANVSATTTGCIVSPNPALTLAYGEILINGSPAPIGTKVEAVTATGDTAGCFIVQKTGLFGLMHVYGEWSADESGSSLLQPGDLIHWRINGVAAKSEPILLWQDDLAPHHLTLQSSIVPLYLPWITSSDAAPGLDAPSGSELQIFLPSIER